MLIHLLGAASEGDRQVVEEFLDLSREERSEADVTRVREMMDHYGSLDYARDYAGGLIDGARGGFEACFGGLADTPHKRFLSELVDFVVTRAF